MYARTYGMVITGLDGILVSVEVDISAGLPCFEIVGLPTASVREAKERVRAAIRNAGFTFPMRRIVINLAPADIRKEGSGLDLAISVAILLASNQLKLRQKQREMLAAKTVFIGELSLEGALRPVTGALAMAMSVADTDKDTICTASACGMEMKAAFSGRVIISENLKQLCDMLIGQSICQEASEPVVADTNISLDASPDFSTVQGQGMAKKALEIAAAGCHHVLFTGSPGAGKTLLAKCFPSILPPLTKQEQLTVSRIYSVAGLLSGHGLLTRRPFRSPHHTVTVAGMTGGGVIPGPGELTLSHSGVLFLDEAPEFSSRVLEILRQPLESGEIHVVRARGSVTFPCRFILLMAMNPCPCGWADGDDGHVCQCTPFQVESYRKRLSGPLMDRLDMVVHVKRPKYEELTVDYKGESSEMIRNRVIEARERQLARMKAMHYEGLTVNSELSHQQLIAVCRLNDESNAILAQAFHQLGISVRSYDRILRVARTIADLSGEERVGVPQLAEAMSYRGSY